MLLVNGCSFTMGDELEGCESVPMDHWPLTWAYQLARKLDTVEDNIANCGSGNDKIFRDTVDYLVKHGKDRDVTDVMVLWSDPIRKETLLEVPDLNLDEMEVYPHISMTQWHERRNNDVAISMSPDLTRIYCNDAIYNYHNTFKRRPRLITALRSSFGTGLTHTLSKMVAMQAICDGMGIRVMQGVFHSHIRTEWLKLNTKIKNGDTSQQVQAWRAWVNDSIQLLRPECKIGIGEYDMTLKEFQQDRPWHPGGHPDAQAHAEFAEYLFYINQQIRENDNS